jgi:hypothetical protein
MAVHCFTDSGTIIIASISSIDAETEARVQKRTANAMATARRAEEIQKMITALDQRSIWREELQPLSVYPAQYPVPP